MKLIYRNCIALQLMFLILFSSIGFNIITSVCYHCEEAHTEVALSSTDNNCSCCVNLEDEHASCCSKNQLAHETNHKKSAKLAQLKVESPEVKSKALINQSTVVLVFLVALLFNAEQFIASPIHLLLHNPPLIRAGKIFQTFICVFRNWIPAIRANLLIV